MMVLRRVAIATLAVLVAAYVVAWMSVFRQPPAALPDTFYWTTALHLAAAVIVSPNLVFGSWLCCFLGMLFGAGLFT